MFKIRWVGTETFYEGTGQRYTFTKTGKTFKTLNGALGTAGTFQEGLVEVVEYAVVEKTVHRAIPPTPGPKAATAAR